MASLLLNADARQIPLADKSVHMVVTSPPYFGLRRYDASDQIGLESTLDAYIANMVAVFRELHRVLRDDGTAWLVVGDSYAGSGGAGGDYNEGGLREGQPRYKSNFRPKEGTFKAKDLMMVPARLAIALCDDGWWLRSEITWVKTSAMPEPVLDRPVSATERIYLLAKQKTYYYDTVAVRQKWADDRQGQDGGSAPSQRNRGGRTDGFTKPSGIDPSANGGANMRNYLILGPEPFKGPHYAAFPSAIPRTAILAGTSAYGVCGVCGAPWERIVEREGGNWEERKKAGTPLRYGDVKKGMPSNYYGGSVAITLGWQPTCDCTEPHVCPQCAELSESNPACPVCHGESYVVMPPDTVPATVLDPFLGSGTTAKVAYELGRHCVGLDISEKYLREMCIERVETAQTPLPLVI